MIKKGNIPWNKGKKGVMPVPWNKGVTGYKIHSDEHKKALSKKFKGRVSPMKGRKHTPETKKKMSLTRKGRKWTKESKDKWSEKCKGKGNNFYGKTHSDEYKERLKKELTGENNNLWKGGITPESKLRLSKAEWKKIRLEVYKRDNYKCRDCGVKCTNSKKQTWKTIQCHHLISWREIEKEDIDNLITLCCRCHGKRHGRSKK